MLYIMLVGFPPFYSEDDQELLQIIAKGRFSFPKREWSSISSSGNFFLLFRKKFTEHSLKKLHRIDLNVKII